MPSGDPVLLDRAGEQLRVLPLLWRADQERIAHAAEGD